MGLAGMGMLVHAGCESRVVSNASQVAAGGQAGSAAGACVRTR